MEKDTLTYYKRDFKIEKHFWNTLAGTLKLKSEIYTHMHIIFNVLSFFAFPNTRLFAFFLSKCLSVQDNIHTCLKRKIKEM